ncbi:MAG: ABC transporter ATP-binding protein [Spirochaetales bacterium]|nr:ABC transporter ATP-binding protein [Spirochaetales bacterium]
MSHKNEINLELKEAEFSYKGGFCLKPVSHTFRSGTFSVLLGPNGSGKTTLFTLLNGIQKPERGGVFIDGQPVHHIPPRARAKIIGLIPQINDRPFGYTVEDMVKMGRYPHQGLLGREGPVDIRIVEETLERLDLIKLRTRSIKELSGGEYQRVLLGRVLVQQPSILLLDEPANHLDLKHQLTLLSLLKEETRLGAIVITVLHDINQALLYGDWGLLLEEGVCISSGKPQELLTPDLISRVYQVELAEYKNEDGSRTLLGPGGKI